MTAQGSRRLKPLKRSDGYHRLKASCSHNSSTSLSSHAFSIAAYEEESLRLWKPYGFGTGSLEIAALLVSAFTPIVVAACAHGAHHKGEASS
jgi:predicted ATPase